MRTWYIEKRVEVDAVAAGFHRETKREIDHTRIWGAVDDTMLSSSSHTRPKPKILTYLAWNKLYSTTDS